MRRGSYTFEDFMDHDGIDLAKPVGIRVRLDVLHDRLRFDFTGTDPQVKGPLNAPLSKAWTTVFFCVMCALPDDISFNDGLTTLIEIYVPEGTLLNPRHPAPVNARSVTVNRVADVVLGALAQSCPSASARSPAACRPACRSAASIRAPARLRVLRKLLRRHGRTATPTAPTRSAPAPRTR